MDPKPTYPVMPTFGTTAENIQPPEPTYTEGYEPLDQFPAQHMNWLMNRLSNTANLNKSLLDSVATEIINVLAAAGLTPSDLDDDQLLQAIQDISHPVGTVFVQFPGKSSPDTLFGGVWSNISASFAGAFFRAEGGNASAFGGGLQAHMFQTHSHSNSLSASSGTTGAHTHSVSGTAASAGAHTHNQNETDTSGSSTDAVYNGPYASASAKNTGIQSAGAHTHTVSGTAASAGDHSHTITLAGAVGNPNSGSSGIETRPDNYTVRIWERVA